MGQRTVAIMQPTYLPWIGYFDMIDRSDVFVFLDDVEFNHRSWQHRNRVKGADGVVWLTVPVLTKGRSDQLIQDVVIDFTQGFPEKHVKTIHHCYSKAPFCGEYRDDVKGMIEGASEKLCELNVTLIEWFCEVFGIDTPLLRSSAMETEGSRAELLLNICSDLEADRYLAAEGSREYLDKSREMFSSREVDITYQSYDHPEYDQLYSDFTPYLSALDLLLNKGPESLSIIRSGR